MQMSTRSVLYLWLITMVTTASPPRKEVFTPEQEKDVISFVETLRACGDNVGLSVAVVRNNLTWTRGFGWADREGRRKTSHTDLFGIASVTKAFTAALLSTFFNDSNGYSWDTRVVDILGKDFKFVNDYLTQHITIKDLLIHRTGLSSTNLPYRAGSCLNPTQFTNLVEHLPAIGQFRDKFKYNNWMYVVAARVTEVLGGAPWAELLRTRILRPLNMHNTTILGQTVSAEDNNVARPYVLLGENTVPSDPAIYRINPLEPAGSIASSAEDMAQWMLLLVNKGRSKTGCQVLNYTRMQEMWSVHMGMPLRYWRAFTLLKPADPVSYVWQGYGYGWVMASYRGYSVIWHPGSLFGYSCYLAVLPDLNISYFVGNSGPGNSKNNWSIDFKVFYYIVDLLLNTTPWLNVSNACPSPPSDQQANTTSSAAQNISREEYRFDNPGRYVGLYRHPVFEDVNVIRNGSDGLYVRYGRVEGTMVRWEEEEEKKEEKKEEEKDHLARWYVQGKHEFRYFRKGQRYYLTLNFTCLSGGAFQRVGVTDPWEKQLIMFERTNGSAP